MFCSKCGARLDESAQFCNTCGAPRNPASQTATPAPVSSTPLSQPQQYLPANTGGVQPQVIVVRSGKSSGLAAVLSFFWCGLGQIYNGQIGKGLILGFLYLVSLFLIIAVVGIITTPILWIYGMVDAYRTAEQMNREVGLA
jgi:TM2 domain-containing membrane protein YozV